MNGDRKRDRERVYDNDNDKIRWKINSLLKKFICKNDLNSLWNRFEFVTSLANTNEIIYPRNGK